MRKYRIGLLIILLVIILAACGNDEKADENNAVSPQIEITEEEILDDDQIVAVINGDNVNGTIYNVVYSQLKLHALQTGQEVEEEEIKELTLESLIDRQLLFQQAKEEGIEITDEIASNEFDAIKSESGDALDNLLAQYQITEAGFKEQLKFELTMNEYMVSAIEVSVTDEEVEQYYEEAKENAEEIPEFEEIKANIERQLLQEKTQAALQAKIDEVRKTADIELKI